MDKHPRDRKGIEPGAAMKTPSKNEIEYRDDKVLKTFNPRSKPGIKSQEEAFAQELAVYRYFERIRWGWAPSLLGYNVEKRQIQIERIRGTTLTEMITRRLEFDVERVINEVIDLDRLLWINRINCLQIKPDDILIEKGSSKIYMVDFEHTYLNSRFKKILYDQLLGPKLLKIEENETKRQFISTLKKRRSQFHRYYLRMTYILCVWLCRRFLFKKKGDNILM